MTFKIDVNRWGGFFSVPCAIAEKYLKLSSGDFLKVLLCVLAGSSPVADTEMIAKATGVSEETAEEALMFWAQTGVLTFEGAPPVKEFASGTAMHRKPAEAINAVIEKKTAVKYTPKDLEVLAARSEDIRFLFSSAQQSLGRTVNSTEQATLVEFHEYYGFPIASIVMILQFCVDIGKGNMRYIKSVIREWNERGILDHHDVENEIARQKEYYTYESTIKRALGLKAQTTKKQKELFEDWQKRGVTEELAAEAAEHSINNTKDHSVNLNYINKTLISWSEQGIKTSEDAEKEKKTSRGSAKSFSVEEYKRLIKDYVPKLSGDDD